MGLQGPLRIGSASAGRSAYLRMPEIGLGLTLSIGFSIGSNLVWTASITSGNTMSKMCTNDRKRNPAGRSLIYHYVSYGV